MRGSATINARYQGIDIKRHGQSSKALTMVLKGAACIFLLLSVSSISSAQQVKISATIDSTTIQIGDQIRLQLTTTYNPQLYRVHFPSIQDTFNHFEVVERTKMDTLIGRNENTYKQTVIITNFDSGQWKIPPVAFDIQSLKGEAPQTLFSDSFLVNVTTLPVDTTKPIKPIFGIRGAKMPIKQLILYIVIALLLAAILGFLIWYFSKKIREKNKKPEHKEIEISLLPHEKALQSLQRIEKEQLWQSGFDKQYHTLLTDVMRLYLEEQFTMDCLEKTSGEIIQQVKRVKALSTSRQSLRTLFETADMVKFAKGQPLPEEHLQSMELAKDVIQESYKKIKPLTINDQDRSTNTQ